MKSPGNGRLRAPGNFCLLFRFRAGKVLPIRPPSGGRADGRPKETLGREDGTAFAEHRVLP